MNGRGVVLPPVEAGWFDLKQSITIGGALARLQADFDVRSAIQARRDLAMSGDLVPGEPLGALFPPGVAARIMRFDGVREEACCAFGLEEAWPVFDQLPDNRWIIANSRCEPGERNARLLSASGEVVGRLSLGDGIEHVQVDSAGNIWVAYFDEGIFGSYDLGGAQPLGAPGLVMYDVQGEVGWAHAAASGSTGINDCGALNVAGDDVWCAFYGDPENATYPVMRLRGGREDLWRTPLRLVDAIAVDGELVAAISQRLHEPCKVSIIELSGRHGGVRAEADLATVGIGDSAPDAVFGRGSRLHALRGGKWFSWDVAELATALVR